MFVKNVGQIVWCKHTPQTGIIRIGGLGSHCVQSATVESTQMSHINYFSPEPINHIGTTLVPTLSLKCLVAVLERLFDNLRNWVSSLIVNYLLSMLCVFRKLFSWLERTVGRNIEYYEKEGVCFM